MAGREARRKINLNFLESPLDKGSLFWYNGGMKYNCPNCLSLDLTMTLTVLDVNPNNVRVDLGENDYNYGRIICQDCNLCGPADYFLTPKTNTYQN